MKLTKWIEGKTEDGIGEPGILLKDEDGLNSGVLSVAKIKGKFRFMEECDGYFHENFTKEQALTVIDELKQWIENQ